VSTVNYNEHLPLVCKNNARRGFSATESNGKAVLGQNEEKIAPPCIAHETSKKAGRWKTTAL
jgi:hypothetical protein